MHQFPSIESLRHVAHYVLERTPLSKVAYRGKVKLHGTHAGVYRTAKGDLVAQSRTRVLTAAADNHGFAQWVGTQTFSRLRPGYTLYGEWFGRGIQKGAATAEVEGHHFAAFALLAPDGTWSADAAEHYEGLVLPWYGPSFVIDFEDLDRARARLEHDLAAVEACDPWVQETFGVTGTGEGLVYYPVEEVPSDAWSSLLFKVKGEKHKVKSTKQKVEIDPEVAMSAEHFAKTFVTETRLRQCFSELSLDGASLPQHTGDVMRWVCDDIQKESGQELEEAGLTWKQVARACQVKIRKQLDKLREVS